jgi:dTDP-4-dehydrorhamnose reductase
VVVPIESSEFPTPAARPAWSLLDNRSFQQQFGVTLPDWKQGLRQVMQALAAQKP